MKYDLIAFWVIGMKAWAYYHPIKSSKGHQKPWFQLEFFSLFHCIAGLKCKFPFHSMKMQTKNETNLIYIYTRTSQSNN